MFYTDNGMKHGGNVHFFLRTARKTGSSFSKYPVCDWFFLLNGTVPPCLHAQEVASDSRAGPGKS